MIKVKNLKVVNQCWECEKVHDNVLYNFKDRDKTIKCECGGNVVTRTGKVKMTLIPVIPIFLIDDGETHRWAADSIEQAIAAHIDTYGEWDEVATIKQITDPIELNRKFIMPEDGDRILKSISEVIADTDEFPALISTSVW